MNCRSRANAARASPESPAPLDLNYQNSEQRLPKEGLVRSIELASASLLLVLAIAPATFAAGPIHENIQGTDVDSDFCGTGQTVNVEFKGVFNGWEDKAFGHVSNTWTNPENGLSVISSFSGGGRFIDVIDDGDGAYTIVTDRVGMPEQIRLANGPLLTQDVGRVIFYDHFDADDNYLGTDVVVHGPHPGLESGFDLWCEVMIETLGL